MGVDGKLDASEEVSGSVGSLSFDVDGSFGQESDEGGHLREGRVRERKGPVEVSKSK